MEPRLEKINWLKKIKTLTHALILSGALNIGFFSALCVIAFKNVQKKPVKTPQALEYTKAPLFVSSDSMELLSQYFDFPYERLIQELKDTHLVEDGYAKRDYALACLVSYHYFDLSKALSGMQLETRTLEFVHQEGGERAKIEVFPGFLDMHFEAIVHFAKLEKWPFTPQGLHVHVKSAKEKGKIPFMKSLYLSCNTTKENIKKNIADIRHVPYKQKSFTPEELLSMNPSFPVNKFIPNYIQPSKP
jgi:hypothetical protein